MRRRCGRPSSARTPRSGRCQLSGGRRFPHVLGQDERVQQQHRFAGAEVDRIALRHGADSKGDTGGIASRAALAQDTRIISHSCHWPEADQPGLRPRWARMRSRSSPPPVSSAGANGAAAIVRKSPSGTANTNGNTASTTAAGSSKGDTQGGRDVPAVHDVVHEVEPHRHRCGKHRALAELRQRELRIGCARRLRTPRARPVPPPSKRRPDRLSPPRPPSRRAKHQDPRRDPLRRPRIRGAGPSCAPTGRTDPSRRTGSAGRDRPAGPSRRGQRTSIRRSGGAVMCPEI